MGSVSSVSGQFTKHLANKSGGTKHSKQQIDNKISNQPLEHPAEWGNSAVSVHLEFLRNRSRQKAIFPWMSFWLLIPTVGIFMPRKKLL